MQTNLYILIDEDISRVVRRVAAASGTDLTMVVPKEALLFSKPQYIEKVLAAVEASGKTLSIVTMDTAGQQLARQYGIELRNLDVLRRSGPSMDMGKKNSATRLGERRFPPRSRSRPAAAPNAAAAAGSAAAGAACPGCCRFCSCRQPAS